MAIEKKSLFSSATTAKHTASLLANTKMVNNKVIAAQTLSAPKLAHGVSAPKLAHGVSAPKLAHGVSAPKLAHGVSAPKLAHGV